MYYPARHCTPSISVSPAVCCSSTSLTVKTTSKTLSVSSHVYKLQCIYVQCKYACKDVWGIHLDRALHFHASNARCVCAEPAETAHVLLVLYVKMLEIENIKWFRARLRETEVSRLFINRTKHVAGSLKVLVTFDSYSTIRFYVSSGLVLSVLDLYSAFT